MTLDEVICHTADQLRDKGVDFDLLATIQATVPLIKPKTIDQAVTKCALEGLDTVLTIVNDPHLAWSRDSEGRLHPLYETRDNRQLLVRKGPTPDQQRLQVLDGLLVSHLNGHHGVPDWIQVQHEVLIQVGVGRIDLDLREEAPPGCTNGLGSSVEGQLGPPKAPVGRQSHLRSLPEGHLPP